MPPLVRLALWLYPLLLRFYPRRFREDFLEEMTAVFEAHLLAAADSGKALRVIGRELRDWPVNLVREHIWERNRQGLLPQRPFLSGWGAAAAMLPFLIYFFSFGGSIPRYLPLYFLVGGVLVAWWQRWPGWVVSWLGFLIFYGQNLLPYSLLGEDPAWNTMPRLLNMFSAVVIQTAWLVVSYWVVRRWPKYGALAFLPVLMLPWFFFMEFASEAMTAVVFSAVYIILALTAVAISLQRTASGDIWLIYGGALLPGILLTLGELFFTPAMGNDFWRLGPNFVLAVGAPVGILLLASLNGWAQERGRAVLGRTRLMSGGALVAFMAVLAVNRLIGPSDLESFQLSVTPVLIAVWLVGVLVILVGGWGLRAYFEGVGRRYLVVVVVLLIGLPLFHQGQGSFLSQTVRGLVFDNRSLTTLEELIPALETADLALFNICLVGLLLLPLVIGRFRRDTAAFPPTSPTRLRGWWQRRKERRGKESQRTTGRSRVKRVVLFLVLLGVVGGGIFLAAVFIPLQLEAEPYTQQAALGDMDGDGDLDMVLANTMRLLPNVDNMILYNNGDGRFTNRRSIGQGGTGVALLDSDGDGDLDIFFGGMIGGSEYRPDENGGFRQRSIPTLQMPESGASQIFMQSGDLNGDRIGDLFLAGCCGAGSSRGEGQMEWFAPANRVLFGSESGLVDSNQQLGERGSQAIDLGDLDGDGDLDAFVGNTQSNGESVRNGEPNEVWFNDGQGNFSDSGQLLGQQRTYAVALGDVDGDGDLDALAGNEGRDELWLNDGAGGFRPGEQVLSGRYTLTVFLGDLDGDGDLDALTGHQVFDRFAWWRQGLIWWNDGDGRFSQGDQRLRYPPNGSLAVGDVNGDGWPDVVCGVLDNATVWLNDGNGGFNQISS